MNINKKTMHQTPAVSVCLHPHYYYYYYYYYYYCGGGGGGGDDDDDVDAAAKADRTRLQHTLLQINIQRVDHQQIQPCDYCIVNSFTEQTLLHGKQENFFPMYD
jgi:hypothetical protein